jgi:hypothetical protein
MTFNSRVIRKELLAAPFSSEGQIRGTIELLAYHVENCQHFYPWPALADSWREDITMLRGLLSARQSKISTE